MFTIFQAQGRGGDVCTMRSVHIAGKRRNNGTGARGIAVIMTFRTHSKNALMITTMAAVMMISQCYLHGGSTVVRFKVSKRMLIG